MDRVQKQVGNCVHNLASETCRERAALAYVAQQRKKSFFTRLFKLIRK
jgi:hypothetical protein